MSVRFIVGRAGSGKTWRCLEAIRAGLREDAARGHKLLLIVPEQASFQMERALIETPDVSAFVRCEVLSFQRLAFRVFAETSADPRRSDQTIGPLGRMMVLRRLIRRERSHLRLLGSVAGKPGVITQLSATMDELMREAVDPGQIAEVAERLDENDPLAASRLADVARLYQAYLDYLVGDRIDPAQYLQLAAERLDGVDWLAGADVWVDGFAGFTRQEYHLLAEVARRVASVEITMLVDPDASAVTSAELPSLSFSRFARAERTLVRLRRELQTRGVEVGEPVRLYGREGASRFVHPALAGLERDLFADRAAGEATAVSSDVIRVLEFADRRAEVEGAIAEVRRLTRLPEGPLRYRDIAIIVRDLSAYHDLVSAGMRACNIPCFIDRRQPTTHHPLVELLRGLTAIACDDWRLESMRLLLKTGLLPLDAEQADLLENYLVAHGIEGLARWKRAWAYTRIFARRGEGDRLTTAQVSTLERINAMRERLINVLGPWLSQADRDGVAWLSAAPSSSEHGGAALGHATHDSTCAAHDGGHATYNKLGQAALDGRAWATALYACLERLNVPRQLEQWAVRAVEDGQPELAETHRQVWRDFCTLLDELVRALGSEPMQAGEFRETLEAGLAEFNLGLAPPTLDAVLVGAVERSRHPEIRAALLLGFDEAHYPMRRGEDPLLGDAEREAMRQANAEIGPSRQQKLTDERMLAYIALTRASERVWISHPRQEVDGKPLQASAYLRDVLAAVPGLQVECVADAETERSADWVTNIGQFGARLAREFRYRPALTADVGADRRAMWNGLYEAARGKADWQQTLRQSLVGLAYVNDAELEPGLIGQVVDVPFRASVSRLECFAACPFRHCADYLLRLEQRVEATMNQVDLGKMCHAILEKFIAELVEAKLRLADLEDDEIAERLERAGGQVLPGIAADLVLENARSEFMIDRGRRQLGRVTRWQRDFARQGRFRPAAVEWGFGYDNVPSVRIITPKGREVLLRGRVDRVDVAELGGELVGMVFDYKRTRDKRLSLVEVYHGLALQLVGYLLALQREGHSLTGRAMRPVGALYLPLLEPYQSVTHPDAEVKNKTRCRGVVDATAIETIDDGVLAGGGWSQFLAATLNKDGRPRKGCDLVETSGVASLVDYVERRMGSLADDLLDGRIGIEPYRLNRRMPCKWCAYRPVCRYEVETQFPRGLEAMNRDDVLARIASEVGG